VAKLFKSSKDILDTYRIREIRLENADEGDTLIRERLEKLWPGMTVAEALKIEAGVRKNGKTNKMTRPDLFYAANHSRPRIILDASPTEPDALLDEAVFAGQAVDEVVEGFEGAARRRFVQHRQREKRLRASKLQEALRRNHGRLVCEVPNCGFDFAECYGVLGKGYAQVHHKEQLSNAPEQGKRVTLDQLAVVCANCHVMIHVGGACRPIESLILPRPA